MAKFFQNSAGKILLLPNSNKIMYDDHCCCGGTVIKLGIRYISDNSDLTGIAQYETVSNPTENYLSPDVRYLEVSTDGRRIYKIVDVTNTSSPFMVYGTEGGVIYDYITAPAHAPGGGLEYYRYCGLDFEQEFQNVAQASEYLNNLIASPSRRLLAGAYWELAGINWDVPKDWYSLNQPFSITTNTALSASGSFCQTSTTYAGHQNTSLTCTSEYILGDIGLTYPGFHTSSDNCIASPCYPDDPYCGCSVTPRYEQAVPPQELYTQGGNINLSMNYLPKISVLNQGTITNPGDGGDITFLDFICEGSIHMPEPVADVLYIFLKRGKLYNSGYIFKDFQCNDVNKVVNAEDNKREVSCSEGDCHQWAKVSLGGELHIIKGGQVVDTHYNFVAGYSTILHSDMIIVRGRPSSVTPDFYTLYKVSIINPNPQI